MDDVQLVPPFFTVDANCPIFSGDFVAVFPTGGLKDRKLNGVDTEPFLCQRLNTQTCHDPRNSQFLMSSTLHAVYHATRALVSPPSLLSNAFRRGLILAPFRLPAEIPHSRNATTSTQFDREYDVVVVGSGAAGLTTAVVAANQGLDVLVVEKTDYFGGTTAYSGGGGWIPNNKHQKALGVTDSSAAADVYLRKVLGPLYEPVRVKAFLESGPEMVRYMEQNSEVRFKPVTLPDYLPTLEGASVGRTLLTEEFDGKLLKSILAKVRYPIQGYSAFGTMQVDQVDMGKLTGAFKSFSNFWFTSRRFLSFLLDLPRFGKGTHMANGNALVGRLLYSCIQRGVVLWDNTTAVRCTLSEGQVNGLVVNKEGKELVIKARKGVVLGSGGFGRSTDDQRKYIPPYHWSAQPRGNTGDGKRIGLEAGGTLGEVNPDNAIFAPISLLQVKNGPIRRYPHFAVDRSKPGSIIVDEYGRRFDNESRPYQEFVNTMHHKDVRKAFFIGDRRFLRKYGMGVALPFPYPIKHILRKGYLIQAASIPELARKIEVNPATLMETVDKMNQYASSGVDPEFHRGETIYDKFYGDPSVKPNQSLGFCRKPPFYALPLYRGNVATVFGLKTDSESQVLDKDDKPITGLYAVGLDQNTVMRGTYPGGGSSLGPGMTFAYRAGLHLGQEKV
jgi:succinate dehydrogenase/fumarate reductase flavoprotein subunit